MSTKEDDGLIERMVQCKRLGWEFRGHVLCYFHLGSVYTSSLSGLRSIRESSQVLIVRNSRSYDEDNWHRLVIEPSAQVPISQSGVPSKLPPINSHTDASLMNISMTSPTLLTALAKSTMLHPRH
jgi:hypothetical protein